ncbi:MAG TPA: hypothetical protein VKX49_21630 [Bryobacteraceae bacterium]|nr:hypothetical protein [Bryobacteraceae bacterium]
MNPQTGVGQAMDSEQLLHLHNLTKDVAKLFRTQLRDCLEALAPLFRPRRVLGDHIEGSGRESVLGADQNFAELKDIYSRVCSRPFDLRSELSTPLESIPAQVQLYEWEYTHDVRTDRDRRTINVVAPMTWVLAYSSTYTFPLMRQLLTVKQERDQESVRAFVLRACIMHLLFNKNPTLGALFEGLRYKVETRKCSQLGELPLITLSAPLRTLRPSDELLVMATGLSGRTAFEEVLDRATAWRIPDPLQDQVTVLLREHGES